MTAESNQRALICTICARYTHLLLPPNLHSSAPGDYCEGRGAAQVRESVSDGSTGGPAAILFVLKASDCSLVFDLHEALDGPSAVQTPHTDPQPL